jgi:hypothetical protein
MKKIKKMYNTKYMGSQLVATGKTKNNVDYRIFNIDNIYTVYIKIDTILNPEDNDSPEPVFSAVESFATLKEAQDYITKH